MGCKLMWCAFCYANIRGRENYKGHRAYRAKRSDSQGDWQMFLKRASGTGAGGRTGSKATGGEFASSYPILAEFLTETRWDDGKPRKTGSLLIFTEESAWKLMLKDKDGGCIAFLTAESFHQLLQVAEEKFREEGLEWRKEKVWKR